MTDWIVWLDLETSGLEPTVDHILEIGAVLTPRSNPQGTKSQFQRINRPPRLEDIIENAHPVVQDMHTTSGLWDELRALEEQDHAYALHRLEEDALAWLYENGVRPKDRVWLGGNSVHFDRRFLRAHLPALERRFFHRLLDVSGAAEVVALATGKRATLPEDHATAHRAMDDIESTRALLRAIGAICAPPA